MLTISTVAPLPLFHADQTATSARRHEDVEDEMDVEDEYDVGEGSSSQKFLTSPGETITSSKEFMRGHGTYVDDEDVVASVTGLIERVNKLVSVRPLKSRYTPEVGDLVVGRIAEVAQQRWKVDANARQDAVLMLSSVNLPGGVQRRKVESDALKMREFLAEGDLLVAEVQQIMGDGMISLHTRSTQYGKLRNGSLVIIPSSLIRRLKTHIYTLPPPCGPVGVDVFLGLNGYIWVCQHTDRTDTAEGSVGFEGEGVYSNNNDDMLPESRIAIALVSNLIVLLARHSLPLTDSMLLSAYNWVTNSGLTAAALLQRDVEEDLLRNVVGLHLHA